eukprot:365898-Chlamydomonas_euryale.AAC.16
MPEPTRARQSCARQHSAPVHATHLGAAERALQTVEAQHGGLLGGQRVHHLSVLPRLDVANELGRRAQLGDLIQRGRADLYHHVLLHRALMRLDNRGTGGNILIVREASRDAGA